ncbi:MAG: His-Xaa-Ser system protein HsxD [Pseudomonas sp.]
MNNVNLTFDHRLYGAESIQKAAYRGMHAFTLDLQVEGDAFSCTLLGNITTAPPAFDKAVEEFKKDVLDYQLRGKLRAETEGVRNLILGVAFSKTGLV